jgi:hypothetical protein
VSLFAETYIHGTKTTPLTDRAGEHSQRGVFDNRTNTIGNYIYTTPMPLQNESKHNNNWIKNDSLQA